MVRLRSHRQKGDVLTHALGTCFWGARRLRGPSVLPSSTVSLFTRQAREDVDAYASPSGVDLDIEGGSSAHYAVFVNEIRSLASGASKK